MILNETVAAIAEAIREKTGKSELIAPVDFAEEIKGITAGGGGESGGERQVTYYSIPNDAEIVTKRLVIGYATYIKGTLSTGTKIIEMAGAFVMRLDNVHDYAEAVAIEWDAFYTNVSGTSVTSREHLAQLVGISVEEFSQFVTPITKEQFYDLNA